VFDEQDWGTIDGWCADADQRWLRTILLGLRELLSSPPTGPRRAPTVAAADRDG
jgi:hypothetical protein